MKIGRFYSEEPYNHHESYLAPCSLPVPALGGLSRWDRRGQAPPCPSCDIPAETEM